MTDQLIERLKVLRAEHEAGQKMLAELEARRAALTSTLLRIEGAIQVLQEITGHAGAAPNGTAATASGLPAGLVHAAPG